MTGRLFIAGTSGYIGRELLRAAKERFDTVALSSSGREGSVALDLLQPEAFDYGQISAGDTAVVTAAISAPDVCANRYDYAYGINVAGTGHFIARVLENGGRVVFYSSDTVYGNKDEPFDETAACAPVGEYAHMKHEVEKRFLGHPGFKVARLSYVFSAEDKFTQYVAKCAAAGDVVDVFAPFGRSVVYRKDVVDATLAMAAAWDAAGTDIVNFCGPECLPRPEFVDILKRTAFPQLKYHVTEPEAAFFVNRPRNINMTSRFLSSILGHDSHRLEEASILEFHSKG